MRLPFRVLLASLGVALAVSNLGCSSSSDSSSDCTYPPIENEAGCPATFDASILYTPCSQMGLECRYPENEYGTQPGICNGPLLISCGKEWGTPLP